MSQEDWKVWLPANLVLPTHSFFLYWRTLRTWLWLVLNHHWMPLLESWNWYFFLSPWILKIFEEDIRFRRPNRDIVSFVPVSLLRSEGVVNDIVWRRCPRRTPWMMLRTLVCSYPIIVSHLSFNFLCLLLLCSTYLSQWLVHPRG